MEKKGPLPNIKAFQEAPLSSLEHNKGLCGNVPGLAPCPNGANVRKRKNVRVVISVTLPLLSALFLLLIFGGMYFYFHLVPKSKTDDRRDVQNVNLFTIWSYDGKMVYENIIEATENFNSTYIIGEGGYGVVYKAELPSGEVVAVKKFFSSQDGDLRNLKSFTSEIRVLTEIRHRNIVKLYGFCSHRLHSFLVYEFLEGGSLSKILSNNEEAMKLIGKIGSKLLEVWQMVYHTCTMSARLR